MRSTSPDANRDPLWRPDSPPTPHGDALYHHSFAAHGHPPSIYVPTSSPEYVASSLHHPMPPLPCHSAYHPQQHMSPHFHPFHQITPNGRSAPNPPDSPSIPWFNCIHIHVYTPTPTVAMMVSFAIFKSEELERSGIQVPQVKKEVHAFYVLAQV